MKVSKEAVEGLLKDKFDQDAFDNLVNDVIHQHRKVREDERVVEEMEEVAEETQGPKHRRFKDGEVFFGGRADRMSKGEIERKAARAAKTATAEVLKL